MIKLTERLLKVADLVGTADTLADIGCDHGFLPLYLIKNNRISNAYACDVREGPLKTARKNIEKYGLSDKIETVLSDGLLKLKGRNTDVISICGMGGRMIEKILTDSEEYAKSVKRIILQPMTEIHLLRDFLANNGYKIKREVIAKEGHRFYNIMQVEVGTEDKNDLFSLHFGGRLIEDGDENLKAYLLNHHRILSKILKAKEGAENTDELKYLCEKLEKTINSINFNENI